MLYLDLADFFALKLLTIYMYTILDIDLKEEFLDTIIYFQNIKVIHLDLKVYGTDQRIAGVKGCLP